jgi:hypothetical protein
MSRGIVPCHLIREYLNKKGRAGSIRRTPHQVWTAQ